MAVNAANLILQPNAPTAETAWDLAIKTSSLTGTTVNKGCPKEAFLGLASCGIILGVPSNTSINIGWNGVYAIAAAWILKNSNATRLRQKGDATQLWNQVLASFQLNSKTHNSQMDVVLELWANFLLWFNFSFDRGRTHWAGVARHSWWPGCPPFRSALGEVGWVGARQLDVTNFYIKMH